jgi:hypothetical protein
MRPAAWIAGDWNASDTVKRSKQPSATVAAPRAVAAGAEGNVVQVRGKKRHERDVATAA